MIHRLQGPGEASFGSGQIADGQPGIVQLTLALDPLHRRANESVALGVVTRGVGAGSRLQLVGDHQEPGFTGLWGRARIAIGVVVNGLSESLSLVAQQSHLARTMVLANEVGKALSHSMTLNEVDSIDNMGAKGFHYPMYEQDNAPGGGADPGRSLRFAAESYAGMAALRG